LISACKKKRSVFVKRAYLKGLFKPKLIIMRGLFLFLIVAAFLAACNNSTEVKSASMAKNADITTQNLKGKVQHFEETSYAVDSSGVSKMDSLIGQTDFDEKGYQSRYSTKDSSGKAHMIQTLARDDKGNFTEIKTMTDGKQTYRLVTEMKDGKYTGGKTYDSTGKPDSYYTDLSENEYGIVYAGKQHFMDGRIKATWEAKYDGPIYLSSSSTDSTGKVYNTDTVKVNDKGDPIDEISMTRIKDSSKIEKTSYKYDSYDDKGNWTQRTTYNEKGKPTKIVKRAFTYYKD